MNVASETQIKKPVIMTIPVITEGTLTPGRVTRNRLRALGAGNNNE